MSPDRLFEFSKYIHGHLTNGIKTTDGRDEFRARCVVSKLYYAVFLRARNKIFTELPEQASTLSEGSGEHGEVPRLLEKNGCKEVADQLAALRRERNNADYPRVSAGSRSSADPAVADGEWNAARAGDVLSKAELCWNALSPPLIASSALAIATASRPQAVKSALRELVNKVLEALGEGENSDCRRQWSSLSFDRLNDEHLHDLVQKLVNAATREEGTNKMRELNRSSSARLGGP